MVLPATIPRLPAKGEPLIAAPGPTAATATPTRCRAPNRGGTAGKRRGRPYSASRWTGTATPPTGGPRRVVGQLQLLALRQREAPSPDEGEG